MLSVGVECIVKVQSNLSNSGYLYSLVIRIRFN